jgi:hypothetical protein
MAIGLIDLQEMIDIHKSQRQRRISGFVLFKGLVE